MIPLDAVALTASLRRMKKLESVPGPGSWAFGEHGLRVAWMGMSEVFEGAA